MAARAIIGIALGILFAPVIWMLLASIASAGYFASWFWSLFGGNFGYFMGQWINAGMKSMVAPIMPSGMFPNSLIEGFGPGSLLAGFIPMYIAGLVTWGITGVWAGAIERSAGRGIGVGVGIWLGWMIIELISLAVMNLIGFFLNYLLAQLFTAIIVIVVAAIFGAMTRSEEI